MLPGSAGCCNSTGKPRSYSVCGCFSNGQPLGQVASPGLTCCSTELPQHPAPAVQVASPGPDPCSVHSGQQHRAASSCSQQPLKRFHSRAHPASHFTVNSFPWHTKSEFLASSTCVASQGLPCHSGSHNRALLVRVWVSALGPLPWAPFLPQRGSGWSLHLLLCSLRCSLHLLGNPLLLL